MKKIRALTGKGLFLLVFLIMTGCASVFYTSPDYQSLYGASTPKQRLLTPDEALLYQQQRKISFNKEVKPILDSRCVACHGCYDAPCQLKLGSIEGIDRGATKQVVYASPRFSDADPTRLFVDATTTAAWRNKDFYPVLNERMDSKTANLDNSVLAKLLELKRLNPQPVSGKLGKEFKFDLDRSLECPSIEELPKFQHEHAQWGMPYAMAGLSLQEENILKQWLQEGSKVEPPSPLSDQAVKAIEEWENYFNGTSLKQKLVFRYIYEHLFIGHLHFKGHPDNEFYQLVRSKTAAGMPIEELKTVFPYSDPGGSFYYRLRPITETIVDKTHFVYELSDAKMQRYNELFFTPDYQVTALPSYQPEIAANPFKTFVDIPLVSKHKFLLDDAQYFVSGFIKGPVCRGQMALSSIRDRFWVVFTQPGQISPQEVSAYLARNAQLLALPGQAGSEINLLSWTKYDGLGKKYLKDKDAFIDQIFPQNKGFGLANIWDGDGVNQNAALTVFRHVDSATVSQGFIGDTPLTGWVVDYATFEQLHYLLVAGFNVYGSTALQLASRTYMDLLRQDAEDNFIRFMPAMERKSIYNSWYPGLDSLRTAAPLFSINHPSEVNFQTTNYKKEFFDQIRQRLGKAAGSEDAINNCPTNNCIRTNTSPVQQQVDNKLRQLSKLQGHDLGLLSSQTLLRVKTGDSKGDLVYTLLIDIAYSNISSMIGQDSKRIPEADRMTVYPGFIGSYPNFFFSVAKEQLDEFIALIENAKTETDIDLIYSKFGVRRTNPEIWRQADWFNEQHKAYRGLEAGLLDMNRYDNL
jgi:hypothetical protein